VSSELVNEWKPKNQYDGYVGVPRAQRILGHGEANGYVVHRRGEAGVDGAHMTSQDRRAPNEEIAQERWHLLGLGDHLVEWQLVSAM
jgi:hypothetical protein